LKYDRVIIKINKKNIAHVGRFVRRMDGMAKGVTMRKVLVLGFILSLLVSAAVLAGCGGGSSSSQTPEQLMKAFFAAVMKGDADTSWNMWSADSQKQLKSKSQWEAAIKDTLSTGVNYEVGKATVNGDKGTVEVTATAGGRTQTLSVSVIKENGVWKVVKGGGT
jgi:uncharacterized protein YchJ